MPIGLGIGLSISLRGGLGGGFPLAAPVLTRTSADDDNTLDFSAPRPSSPPIGLRSELQVATDVNFTPPPTETDLGDVVSDPVTWTTSAVADGTYWARARWIDASDDPLSDWSNVLNFTITTSTSVAAQFLMMRAA